MSAKIQLKFGELVPTSQLLKAVLDTLLVVESK